MDLPTFNNLFAETVYPGVIKTDLGKRTMALDMVMKYGEWDEKWSSGDLQFVFNAARPSSVRFGGLSPVADISRGIKIKGTVSEKKTITGSLKFLDEDIRNHTVTSLLPDLLDDVDDLVDQMKEKVNLNFLNGPYTTRLTEAATDNDGIITVEHPHRLELEEMIVLRFNGENDAGETVEQTITGDVHNYNINSGQVLLFDQPARGQSNSQINGEAAPLDFSQNNIPAGTRLEMIRSNANVRPFMSFREQLLMPEFGGSETLFGRNKRDFPVLQALNFDGSQATGGTILDIIFRAISDAAETGRKRGEYRIQTSVPVMNAIMRFLEFSTAQYKHLDTTVSMYGYQEVKIAAPGATAIFEVINELDSDIIMAIDWSTVCFKSNKGGFREFVDQNGNKFTTIRDDSIGDHIHVKDYYFEGELIVKKPTGNWIMYGIDRNRLEEFQENVLLSNRTNGAVGNFSGRSVRAQGATSSNVMERVAELSKRVLGIDDNKHLTKKLNELEDLIAVSESKKKPKENNSGALDAALDAVDSELNGE